MKFFLAVRQAAFAAKAFAAAGLDFEAAFAANNEAAIKASVEAAVASAPAKNDPEQEKLIAEAVKENERMSAELSVATKCLSASGLKVADVVDDKGVFSEEKFRALDEKRITKAARDLVAKSGHSPVEETPVSDGAKPAAKKEMARSEFNQLTPFQQSQFCLKGGRVTE